MSSHHKISNVIRLWFLAILAAIAIASVAAAQTTIATGSIVGTITDSSGAVVSGAKVAITSLATGDTKSLMTNSAGVYSSGPLTPGSYRVEVGASGFRSVSSTLTVLVGNTATFNPKLQVGQENQTVEVQANEVQVNTEQATVQGVLTEQQIDNLPVNGRNFLDLAQLEPGVQIQDGQNFDPTKAGYSSISFGGRFGRTARIEVDGVDVSDETVGTTTEDIPEGAIQEFQVSQSSLDMSTELTSSGAVNVTTKSGTNAYHGQAYGAFRDSVVGAASLPVPQGFTAPYQRSQYGGNFGGPLIKDKLFFFMDGERTVQNTQVPVPISPPFASYSGTFADPFREGELLGRVDYQLASNVHVFGRYSYFKNLLGATFGYGYSLYDNKDITRNDVVGVDWNTGSFTHQIRFAYLKFQNQIVDATTGSNLPFANIHAELFMGATGLVAGPNLLAPQSTPQSDHELKYDGTKVKGSHVIRYGVSYNHIQGGGFASFFKNGPEVSSLVSPGEMAAAATGPFPGGASNPFNYPADQVVVANGLGYSTTNPGLGFPAGGLGPDNRILLYLGDTWKLKPNFALTYGLRYDRDTGRTDSQYPAIPGLNALMPGLGNAVKQPNSNWAPQIGFAWDPKNNGKTSIRGGIGLFYENAIWNNVLFDGPYREATGGFLQYFPACSAPGSPIPLQTANGTINGPGSQTAIGVCGTSSFPLIGNALPSILALQSQYQNGSPLNLQAANPSFVGAGLTACGTTQFENCFFPSGFSMFNPDYKSPRSVQMNIGVQREIHPGLIFQADFIRNVQTHFLLGVDQNHVGDVRYFNKAAAMTAINATNASFGCAAGTGPGVDCAIGKGATIANYANAGLTSSADFGGTSCYSALGYACAFGGINPLAPELGFLSPVGRSDYNGLQMKLTQNVKDPLPGVHLMNLTISYALSRFDNSGGGVSPDANVTASSGDQDFIVPALDGANVNRYYGPSTLDRTHQLSFGGYMNVKGGFQLGLIAHFDSPLSTTLTVPHTTNGAGEIFRTDFTGSGVTQDPIPGTTVGSFGRSINASNINTVLSNYNTNVALNPTPAGQTLISSGLFTPTELGVGNALCYNNPNNLAVNALCAVAPPIPLAPSDQVNYPWLKAFDITFGWQYKIGERITLRPQVGIYNLFNFANFDLPESMMSGLLTGGVGSINGTNYAGQFVNRVGVGTGVYTMGAPRETEFQLKIDF